MILLSPHIFSLTPYGEIGGILGERVTEKIIFLIGPVLCGVSNKKGKSFFFYNTKVMLPCQTVLSFHTSSDVKWDIE